MTTRMLAAIAVLLSVPGVAAAQDSLPEPLRQVRALIDSGRFGDAIRAAQRYSGDYPRDERGFLIQGDAWFKQMPVGRFRAAQAYQEAERLAPDDPEPPYQYAQVGLWLGGDDGEGMAKQGLERVLELDPLYRDAWDEWLTLFRGSGSRRRMRERLASHPSAPIIRTRLALLAIEDEQYADADALLDSALASDSTNAAWLALRAQSAFEAGDSVSGQRFYRRALAHADRDSIDALWRQVIGIAQPSEIRAWTSGVAARHKGAWLEAFWARRNPNLFAGVNPRVAEHFARLRHARKHHPLLHPLVSYHRSQIARAMNLEPSFGERAFHERCEMYEVLLPPHLPSWVDTVGAGREATIGLLERAGQMLPTVSRASDRARIDPAPGALLAGTEFEVLLPNWLKNSLFAPLNLNLRSVDSIAARIGYNLATGLDDRGVMYLRLGPPDRTLVGGTNDADPQCSTPDVERWGYAEYGEVRFSRASAFSRGLRNVPDMVFRPMNERQFQAMETGLTTDASSVPAPLDFGVWTAQFGNPTDPSLTDLVVVSTRGTVAASLTGPARAGRARVDSSGVVTLNGGPGPYVLLAQAEDSGRLGRQTLRITLKRFDRGPALSELLLAPAWSAAGPDRGAMLGRLERSLVFRQGSPIRCYAEIYGLTVEDGTVGYQVQYELLRTAAPERDIRVDSWPEAIHFEFQRERPAARPGTEPEILDITPDRTPPGKYLLRLRVFDRNTGQAAGVATISFAVR